MTFLCGLWRVTEARCVAVKSLHGGLTGHCIKLWKWSLTCFENFKMLEVSEPGDICQEPSHTRIRTNPWKRGLYLAGSEAELSKPFDIRCGATGFGVCPTGFWLCFGPIFPHFVPVPLIWDGNVHYVLLYVESRRSIFDFAGLQLRDLLESQRRHYCNSANTIDIDRI